LAAAHVVAKDLGVQGRVWPITERDMREVLMESAARADWDKAQEGLVESARTYFSRLPKRPMPTPLKTETHWVVPAITLDSDIRIPEKQTDGSFAWKVLYPAGTVVNGLAYAVPDTAMLFFDGNDKDQVALVRQATAKYPAKFMAVEATGANVKEISELAGFPIYYGSPEILSRFQISKVPSVLYAGTGSHSLHLGVTEFARPFRLDVLEATVKHLLPKPINAKRGAP
jgi:hypothetical protein